MPQKVKQVLLKLPLKKLKPQQTALKLPLKKLKPQLPKLKQMRLKPLLMHVKN